MRITKKDISLARAGLQTLNTKRRGNTRRKPARVILEAETSDAIVLPPQAIEVLTEVLGHLAEGREVTVTAAAEPIECSTQQAAQYLRVSRPFLVGLLEKGAIPFRKVGSHRRVLFADLKSYKDKIDARRLKTLDELAAQAQELGFGY